MRFCCNVSGAICPFNDFTCLIPAMRSQLPQSLNACWGKNCFSFMHHIQKYACAILFVLILAQLKRIYVLKCEHKDFLKIIVSDSLPFQEYMNQLGIGEDIDPNSTFQYEILSSQKSVKLAVNGQALYDDSKASGGRGLHLIVINPKSGQIKGSHIFDTFSSKGDSLLVEMLTNGLDGEHLLVFAVKDEASLKLSQKSRKLLTDIGSKHVYHLKWRSLWAMICWKGGADTIHLLNEHIQHTSNVSKWPEPVYLKVTVDPKMFDSSKPLCDWPPSEANSRRIEFCSKYFGYNDLCTCSVNNIMQGSQVDFSDNLVKNVHVVVIASNRPHYLYRMLKSLLGAHGVNTNVITVFIDGYFEETMDVVKLFGVHGIFHMPSGVGNARISQNYFSSFNVIFSLYPEAQHCIVLEEDLEVSPDFFRYFSQTISLLDTDESLYCISAWNDQGYAHSSEDTTLLYRVETMPGLGWMFKRDLFENELKDQWPGPDKQWDWDMWIRHPEVRKGRECVIPDVSRTFHFGETGLNMNSHFYQTYFSTRKLNNDATARLKNVNDMCKDKYERNMHRMMQNALVLDHSKSPCDEEFAPANASSHYVAYFGSHNSTNFINVVKCLRLWDLDARGLHKNAFRTFIRKTPVIFVGYPASPYSIYKPVDIKPLSFEQL
uniref:Alpha-1,3-mannosyl-glycoprotein 2-beta-N-acetylglucosaminyltransferase n=1 Tax=Phallusia mammillata TaxID=59560 RepID=A0A6F9DPT3_9ASCI|nr:protein O-linked-mannose beta-1,2-N-acetylglucosaminyltransferase 1 [Phallusia mammillata]